MQSTKGNLIKITVLNGKKQINEEKNSSKEEKKDEKKENNNSCNFEDLFKNMLGQDNIQNIFQSFLGGQNQNQNSQFNMGQFIPILLNMFGGNNNSTNFQNIFQNLFKEEKGECKDFPNIFQNLFKEKERGCHWKRENHHKFGDKAVHYGVACDGCNAQPIVGDRYKCQGCENFDFCEKCHTELKQHHPSEHQFTKIDRPFWRRGNHHEKKI